jgi:hypothetical protein
MVWLQRRMSLLLVQLIDVSVNGWHTMTPTMFRIYIYMSDNRGQCTVVSQKQNCLYVKFCSTDFNKFFFVLLVSRWTFTSEKIAFSSALVYEISMQQYKISRFSRHLQVKNALFSKFSFSFCKLLFNQNL